MSISYQAHYLYRVQPGDTVYALARRFYSTVEEITQANHLYPPVTDPYLIYPGQLLVIPSIPIARPPVLYLVSPGDVLFRIAQRFSTHVDLLAGINPEISNPDLIYPGQQVFVPALMVVVESSDTLYRIAERFGVSAAQLMRANQDRPGFSADLIWPGYRLIVPTPTSENIMVYTPFPGTVFDSVQRVSGWGRAFEANLLVQVRDARGVTISEERAVTATEGAPAYGWFETLVPFDRQPTTDTGEIWVYTRSAMSGEIEDLVRVKVRFDLGR